MARTGWMRPALIEALCAGLALFALQPLTTPGHLWGHDTGAHLFRLAEVARALGDGVLYPRFLPDAYGGLGGPILTFNPTAPYYLPALLVLAGVGPIAALKIAAGLLTLAGGVAMRILARPHLGRVGAAVAALAWIYLPYRIANLYVRMAYSELAVMMLLPLAMAAGRRAAARPSGRRIAVAAILTAAIPAVHFPGAVLGIPLVAAWAAAFAPPGRRARAIAVTAAFIILGLALSAVSWLPAMAEIGGTHYEESAGGPDHYSHHFVSLEQIVSPSWGFGSSMPGASDRMSFQAGWVHLMLLAAAAGAAVRVRAVRPVVFPCCAVALAGLFLMLPLSRGLWAVIPALQNVQFPWRALMLVGIATSLASGLVSVLPGVILAAGGGTSPSTGTKDDGRRRSRDMGPSGKATGSGGARVRLHGPAGGMGPSLARVLRIDAAFERLRATRAVTIVVIALLVAACLPYLQARRGEGREADFTPEAFRGRYFGELKFQPLEVGVPNFKPEGARAILQSGGRARIVSEATHRMTVEVDTRIPTTMRLHLFASPGWRASVDGVEAEVRPEPGTGLVLVHLPAGSRLVELRYSGTAAARTGWVISWSGLIVAGGAIIAGKLRKARR